MGSYQLRYTNLLYCSYLFVMGIEALVVMCSTLRGVLLLKGRQKLLDTVILSAYLLILLTAHQTY